MDRGVRTENWLYFSPPRELILDVWPELASQAATRRCRGDELRSVVGPDVTGNAARDDSRHPITCSGLNAITIAVGVSQDAR
jgi:hypothetical protein